MYLALIILPGQIIKTGFIEYTTKLKRLSMKMEKPQQTIAISQIQFYWKISEFFQLQIRCHIKQLLIHILMGILLKRTAVFKDH